MESDLISDTTQWLKEIEELRRVVGILTNPDFLYRLRKYSAAYNALLTRYAPFKVGDRVRLSQSPSLANAPGWSGCEHFLVKGGRATVVSLDITPDNGLLWYHVAFDEESWYDDRRVLHMIEPARRHSFAFREDMLEKDE